MRIDQPLHFRTIANVRVGKPDVDPAAPSHMPGIREGNRPGGRRRNRGMIPIDGWSARGTAARSTGINARARNPIDPRSPNLSPS
jgi:hypothetical protein